MIAYLLFIFIFLRRHHSYDKRVRPVVNHSRPTRVSFSMSLYQILAVVSAHFNFYQFKTYFIIFPILILTERENAERRSERLGDPEMARWIPQLEPAGLRYTLTYNSLVKAIICCNLGLINSTILPHGSIWLVFSMRLWVHSLLNAYYKNVYFISMFCNLFVRFLMLSTLKYGVPSWCWFFFQGYGHFI